MARSMGGCPPEARIALPTWVSIVAWHSIPLASTGPLVGRFFCRSQGKYSVHALTSCPHDNWVPVETNCYYFSARATHRRVLQSWITCSVLSWVRVGEHDKLSKVVASLCRRNILVLDWCFVFNVHVRKNLMIKLLIICPNLPVYRISQPPAFMGDYLPRLPPFAQCK